MEQIGGSKGRSLFSRFNVYNEDSDPRVVDTRKQFSDFETGPLVEEPLLKSVKPSATVKARLINPVGRRADDTVRISKLMTKAGGITWVAHQAELESIQRRSKEKMLDAGLEHNDASVLKFLKNIGKSLLDTAHLTAKTLTQVAASGTGLHITPYLEARGYLKDSTGKVINGAERAIEGTGIRIDHKVGERKDSELYKRWQLTGSESINRQTDVHPLDNKDASTEKGSLRFTHKDKYMLEKNGDESFFLPGQRNIQYFNLDNLSESDAKKVVEKNENYQGEKRSLKREYEIREGERSLKPSHFFTGDIQYEEQYTMPSTDMKLAADNSGSYINRMKTYFEENEGTFIESKIRGVGAESSEDYSKDRHFVLYKGAEGTGTGTSRTLSGEDRAPQQHNKGAYTTVDFTSASLLESLKSPSNPNALVYEDSYSGLIPFMITSITPEMRYYLEFEANLESFDDSFTGTWSNHNYVGRAEKFWIYNNFDRKINFSFIAVSTGKQNLMTLYKRLNKLAGVTAPTYKNGVFMRGTLSSITIGEYVTDLKGIIGSVKFNWEHDYMWELDSGKSIQVPMVLKVSVDFTPIHDFVPTSLDLDYFGYKGTAKSYQSEGGAGSEEDSNTKLPVVSSNKEKDILTVEKVAEKR